MSHLYCVRHGFSHKFTPSQIERIVYALIDSYQLLEGKAVDSDQRLILSDYSPMCPQDVLGWSYETYEPYVTACVESRKQKRTYLGRKQEES